ncbi:hypothetical protein HOP50_09g54610 [Chloropicon primus]|uniref:DUF7876 domain-containing protein n=1 Tax=Chloropicon primus TaxID=1764295 RepID=A0A5B8MU01_9CHLO|nr:hypothetical protein A3770_09p54300 [Chloropicon primus]UPR02136.1 hypothetical protein HOP50_09g54610 [Chloropicon primus]|eukprot:QDZ22912.1 hypothetical protein A3770_09p54300 [Chloropicon primus]
MLSLEALDVRGVHCVQCGGGGGRDRASSRRVWSSSAKGSAAVLGAGGGTLRENVKASSFCRRNISCKSASSSGRDLALSVTRTFDTLQNPAVHNVTYSGALNEFVRAAILAYECGCSHEVLRQAFAVEGGKLEGGGEGGFEGYTEVGLVWLSIRLSRVPDKRWSTGGAVDKEFEKRWLGFVKLIANAYFGKRMAWYPIDKLQLEQVVSCEKVDPPDIVAERARLVFTTLRFMNFQGY